MNNIILGTAQFGMEYGINNKRGRVPRAEAFDILNKAVEFGMDTVDTAYAYGESEKVLGNFMKLYHRNLKVISKLPKCEHGEVKEILDFSLNKLNISTIYGYLIHAFESFKKDRRIWDELEKLKNADKIENIGLSLYLPSELESVLSGDLKIDMVQVPFNIFDQRFKPYFPELKKRKVKIYVRSVFLQGLLFKKTIELDNYFEKIRDKIEKLNLLSKDSGVPIFALCLNFVVQNEYIDKVVVGVDSIQQFIEIMQAPDFIPKLDNIIPQLSGLRVDDEKIILPFNWDLHRVVA